LIVVIDSVDYLFFRH